MIFDLQNKEEIIPEIGDKFTVLNGEKSYIIRTEESKTGDCSGCAFENMCKDSDFNQTQFTCFGEDRPDKSNVIFIWE